MRLKVSVIATVRNEEGSVGQLLDSLQAQTRPPDEVVIADGGSTDRTLEILRAHAEQNSLPVRVLSVPGANISEGRNAAIEAARGDIIASTDAGVRLSTRWLEELTRPFEGSICGGNGPDIVSGFFRPDPQSAFETALGATTLPELRDIRPDKFLPSSRSVAFRKAVWERVGGYPIWLTYSEDVLFDLALKNQGYHFVFAPGALVYFRPRTGLWAFWRQYRGYAMGDGEGLLWTGRHLLRYTTYLLLGPLLLGLGFHQPLWWLVFLLAVAANLWTPYRRLIPALSALTWSQRLMALVWPPFIRVWGDLAKMVGYPMGLPRGWRNRNRTRDYLDGTGP